MGGAERVEKHHSLGKLTVRERVDHLLDPGSFHEVGSITGSAEYGPDGAMRAFTPVPFIFGRGMIDGRPVVVAGDDFTVRGGSADFSGKRKQEIAEQMARELPPANDALDRRVGRRRVGQDVRADRLHLCAANPAWDDVSRIWRRCRSWRWRWAASRGLVRRAP